MLRKELMVYVGANVKDVMDVLNREGINYEFVRLNNGLTRLSIKTMKVKTMITKLQRMNVYRIEA